MYATDPLTGLSYTQQFVEPDKVASEVNQLVKWTEANEKKVIANLAHVTKKMLCILTNH